MEHETSEGPLDTIKAEGIVLWSIVSHWWPPEGQNQWDTVVSIGYQWRIGRLMEIGEGSEVGWTQCTPPGFSGGQLAGTQTHRSPPESTEGLWVSSGSQCRSLPIDAVSTAGYITGNSRCSTFKLLHERIGFSQYCL